MQSGLTNEIFRSLPGRLALVASLCALAVAFLPSGGAGEPPAFYSPLHSALEILAIVVSGAIGVLVWESRAYRNLQTLYLGGAFLVVAWLDLAHLFAYGGFPGRSLIEREQGAIDFWLAARMTTALALIYFALRVPKPVMPTAVQRSRMLLVTSAFAAAVTVLLIVRPAFLPSTVSGIHQLTPFKIHAEWVIVFLFAGAAIMLARRYGETRDANDPWLAAAAWGMGLGESMLILYADEADLMNLFGHLLRVVACALAYRALVSQIVHLPYERLAAESVRNHTVLDTVHDGIIVIDRNGQIVEANLAFAEMLGWPQSDVRRLSADDFIPPGRLPTIGAMIEQLSTGERIAPFETQFMRKDGSLVDLELAVNRAALPGEEEYLVVAARPIADRKATASMRLASEVFLHAHIGLLVTDATGHIVDLNPTASEITGYSRQELLGKLPSVLKSGRHNQAFYEALWQSLLKEGFWSGEICNRRKSGELYYEQLSISAIRHGEGGGVSYLAVFSDITLRKLAEDKMRSIAHFDSLTGLPNRLLLADRLDQAIAHNARNDKLLAICFMDLDGFKQVNDSLGHEAGDQLLREVALRLQAMLRASDTVARLGGDEFVMLIANLDSEEECCQALDRVLTNISTPYILAGNVPSEISVSIGVTLYPNDSSDPDTLLRHADHAMYAAKQAGKNCYQLFDARMEERLQARQDTLRRVARGLAAEQFQLHYQPKVDYRAGQVVGVEALIRWNHPVLGMLSPSEFLPLLEDDDLALTLGEWVFREALRQGRRWQAQGLALKLSVNAFPRQLQRPNFAEMIAKAISECWPEMPRGTLIVEIPETSALLELEGIQKALQACRHIGVGFSLDDFGTGYASLSYLRKLTADELKIDQSFIRDMLIDAEDLSIIDGVIGLGRAFHMNVVAEGVEAENQADHLLDLGCTIMQGYYFAKPMPADILADWLKDASDNVPWKRP